MLSDIAHQLHLGNQAKFRLVCKSWRDAHQAQTLCHRVTLQFQPDWKTSAQTIRQICPSIIVVVVVNNIKVVPAVLDSPLCDKVLYSSPPDAVHTWKLSSHCGTLDRALDFKEFLNKVQELLNIPDYRHRLELCLSLRAAHAGLQAVQTALRKLQAALCELHVVESLAVCATNAFPLNHIKALAFTLPYKPGRSYQAAIVSLPSLESLHVHANTAKAACCIPHFLKILLQIQTVSVLKVSTLSNCLTLSATSLQHVTYLQLGSGVTVNKMPAALQHLRLQALHRDLLGILPVFQELEQLDRQLEVTLDTFSPVALLHLPTNLERLTLLQQLQQPSSDSKTMSDCHSALSRLSNLKVLVLADYVTPYISYMLKGLVCPHVHTLGFCLASDFRNSVDLAADHVSRPLIFSVESPMAVSVSNVFPNVQYLRIYSAMDKPMTPAVLHCSWIDKPAFKQLRSLTCYCSPVAIQLCDVPNACCVAFNPGKQLGV